MQPAISQDQTLTGLTRVAAHLFGVPISLLSIAGPSTLNIVASSGWKGPASLSRHGASCEEVLLSKEPVFVNHQSGLLAGLCFYAGHPIRTSSGDVIGSLCVADFEVRYPAETQFALLPALASLAGAVWESRGVPLSLSTLAHEVRNPLNGVLGAADLLEKDLENLNQREVLDALRGSAELLMQIVNRSLEQSGPKLTGAKPFPLKQLIKTLVRNLRPLSAQNDIAMTLHLDPDLP